jgi:hypothetical protein
MTNDVLATDKFACKALQLALPSVSKTTWFYVHGVEEYFVQNNIY